MNSRVKLDVPTEEQIRKLAEVKATRDILVHNRGIVNAVYLAKVGGMARYSLGDRIELRDSYLVESWFLIKQVVTDLTLAAMGKLS